MTDSTTPRRRRHLRRSRWGGMSALDRRPRPAPGPDRFGLTMPQRLKTDMLARRLLVGPGGLWVAAGNGVMPVDPRTGRPTGAPVVIGGDTRALVVAGESLWALIGTGYDPLPPSEPNGTPNSVRRPARDYTLVRIDARRR